MGDSPGWQERMVGVLQAARSAGHGGKAAVYAAAAAELGVSVSTIKRNLSEHTGRQRRRRTDAGVHALSLEEARLLSAYLTESTRGNAKRLLTLEDGVAQLRANGKISAARLDESTGELTPLSLSAIARALRSYQLHPDQLKAPEPVTRLISKHPNHVWQLDASLCVLYYLRPSRDAATGLKVMSDAEFNKNKPANLERVEPERVWRYVVTDHTSGAFYVEYVLGAESALNITSVFINAIQRREGQPFHGVPYLLMMDPGSANLSAVSRNLFTSLQVGLQINKPGNPRAKGQVESTNNLVERRFESGLRFVPVRDIAHLNRLAQSWTAWFNGTAEHSRHGETRYAAWQRIREDQLRLAPPAALCKELARSSPKPRVVSPDLKVSFGGRNYHVDRVPGVLVGERLLICRNPYREDGVQAVTFGEGGRECYHLLEPVQTDEWGQDTRGAVIGEEHKSRTKTGAQYAREAAERLVMGVESNEDAETARKAKTLPFRGTIDPYKLANDYQPPAWMPKRGHDLGVTAPQVEAAPLSLVTAAKRLRAELEAIGGEWSPRQYQWLASRYPDGVPEAAIEGLVAEMRQADSRPQLRIVP